MPYTIAQDERDAPEWAKPPMYREMPETTDTPAPRPQPERREAVPPRRLPSMSRDTEPMNYRRARYDREPVMDVDDDDFDQPQDAPIPAVLSPRNQEPTSKEEPTKPVPRTHAEKATGPDADNGVERLNISLSAVLPACGLDAASSLVVIQFNGAPVMQRASDWILVAKKIETWANRAMDMAEPV